MKPCSGGRPRPPILGLLAVLLLGVFEAHAADTIRCSDLNEPSASEFTFIRNSGYHFVSIDEATFRASFAGAKSMAVGKERFYFRIQRSRFIDTPTLLHIALRRGEQKIFKLVYGQGTALQFEGLCRPPRGEARAGEDAGPYTCSEVPLEPSL